MAIRTSNAENKIVDANNTIFIETLNTKNHVPANGLQPEGRLYYISPTVQIRTLIGNAAVRSVTASTVIYAAIRGTMLLIQIKQLNTNHSYRGGCPYMSV